MAAKKKTKVSKSKNTPKTSKSKSKKVTNAAMSIELPPVLDIVHAGDFCDDVNKLFASKPKPTSIEFDGSKIERITTPGVQIILAAVKQAEASKVDFKMISMSEVMKSVFEELGFKEQILNWGSA